MKIMLIFTMFTLVALFSACSTPKTEVLMVQTGVPPADYQWVQLGDGGSVIVRAVYKQTGQNCPSIDTTDKNGIKSSVAMQTRGQNNMPQNFSIMVCEATLTAPEKLASAALSGKNLTLPTKSPKRIVVLGDTGCRVKGKHIQNCNDNPNVTDAEKWLFTKTIADAAALKPDLIIHVGDYLYRESPCPESAAAKCCPDSDINKCKDSAVGDKWATWETDFFKPANKLLEAVPWVFARGNHESCQREFGGWYLFLDPRALTNTSFSQCVATSAPFNVSLDGLSLLVLDSSNEGNLNEYNKNAIENLTGSVPVWLVTHVPLYGISDYGNSQPYDDVKNAIKKSPVKFLVSGHIHFFEMLLFKDQPPQMVAGGGATELDPNVPDSQFKSGLNAIGAIGEDKTDPQKPHSEIIDKFTFTLIEVKSDGWHITVIDQDGKSEAQKFVVKNP